MLTFPGSLKVFLAMDAADLRQSFTGLWAVTVNVLKDDPSTGALYVYTNRRHNRVKILYWDGTGLGNSLADIGQWFEGRNWRGQEVSGSGFR